MEALEAIKKLESYPSFKEFKKINKDSYLTHAFAMIEDASSNDPIDNWQIGFYDDKKDKITIFDVGKKITQSPESEVFKNKKTIKKLDISNVIINLNMAFEIVDKLLKEKHPFEFVSKKIIILQNFEEENVWNITYITMKFNIFNVRIDVSNGKVVHSSFESLLSWQK
ncbi:MAG: hypothetical protein QXG00_00985 [Candidatus Woesearchaeota archaeon]